MGLGAVGIMPDLTNGLQVGDFARYRDGSIVRVLETKPNFFDKWTYTYSSTGRGSYTKNPNPVRQTWNQVKCIKILTADMKDASIVKRRKSSYTSRALVKINIDMTIQQYERAIWLLTSEKDKKV
jgi:hypothetical protein